SDLLIGKMREKLFDAAADEKVRLRREARDLQACLRGGARDGGEVHPSADVLHADVNQRIVVKAMPEVAQQSAVTALVPVVLLLRQTIVDEQRDALFERIREASNPRLQAQVRLRRISIGKRL